MTEMIPNLAALADRYDAVFCDLWGCYHDGLRPYPEAVAALRAYRAAGGLVLLLTNAPRPAASVAAFLDRIGAPLDTHDGIMSSGAACQRALAGGRLGRRFHYVGPPRDLHLLTETGLAPVALEAADAILCTGLEDDDHALEPYLPRVADWVARGLPLVCANPDIVVDRGTTRLWCAGALGQAHEQAGGRVVWFGKPHLPVYDQSFERLAEIAGREIARERILAIGDGIATDVAGGHAAGLDVLFVTGGLAAEELGPDPLAPDAARLAEFLARHGQSPAYAIGRLR